MRKIKVSKIGNSGGATIEYAIFLCVASVLLVSGIAYLGIQYRPQLVAWHQGVEIDKTAVGSISTLEEIGKDGSITTVETGPDNVKTYRVHKLPKGLQPR